MESMLITLTTDFGTKDPFVGIMKGVISTINPQARVIDLCHGIPPQDLMAAALVVRHSVAYFPRRTIHVAVVDPGVGSKRRALLIESGENYFIGPDNGVFSLALEERAPTRIVELSNSAYHQSPASATFHGRDIFAPIAAYLSLGIPPENFGPEAQTFIRLPWPKTVRTDRGIEGEIVYVDSFGNLITNIRERELREFQTENATVSLGALIVRGLALNYTDGKEDGWVALINSWGLLEISRYHANAQQHCRAAIGDKVHFRLG
jgi:S-adenosyl-L-methionine hydrolase (adenosine-forming)